MFCVGSGGFGWGEVGIGEKAYMMMVRIERIRMMVA